MITNSTHKAALISPSRSIAAKVELYDGSTLLNTFNHTDALSSFTVSRAGAKKFFGFGVCQEAELKLIDKERAINVSKNQHLKVRFTTNGSIITPFPYFYIDEISRDENTNQITIKAYDKIYQAKEHTFAELNMSAPYTVLDVVDKITKLLGSSYALDVTTRDAFNVNYPNGANFDGTETLREVLDAIAEATQTIYYITRNNNFRFKHMSKDGDPVLTIRKDDYFTLDNQGVRILSDICSATELGDNVVASTGSTGETQYVRDNPFWDLRDDIATLLNNAIGVVGGLSINQFNCKWRGNYLLEPGDKIAISTKDDGLIYTYLLDDKLTYNGGIVAQTSYEYTENSGESANNPVTIGDSIKQTFAKVDKANKQIDLVVSDVSDQQEQISTIQMTQAQISTSVSDLTQNVDDQMTSIRNEVSTKMTSEDVQIMIESQITDEASTVTTTTGFTFDADGLTINKSGSEITTQITEDGMTVYRSSDAVLIANNEGVKAEDLHATTYLIVGNNSRFEDMNGNRTACFWIGG